MNISRFLSCACVVLGVSLFTPGPGAAAEPFTFSLATSGKAGIYAGSDVLSDKASEAAVQTLAKSLGQIFGSEFSVQSGAPGPAGGIHIRLASKEEQLGGARDLAAKGPNAFLLKSEKGCLHIIGNSQAAIQNGIYTVLDELGCRWYFPGDDWTYLPKLSSYEYSADRIVDPSFKFCRLFPGIGRPGTMVAWSARNRLNRFDKGYIHHTPGLDPKLFAERPELFALRNGVRTRKQICIGNPEARKMVVENTVAYLKAHPGISLASVEPPDNLAHCQDPSTLALGNGSPSDAVFFLANETAREVGKAFPEAYVGLYAYLAHANPPSFDLEKNIYVEIATNLRQTDLSIPEAIKAFRERGAQVGIRDYLSIPQWHQGRIGGGSKGSNFVDTPKEIATWGNYGIVGYSAEMSDNWACNGLTYFLVSQVLWNRDCDVDREAEHFYRNMFGEAAPVIREMYERWQKKGLTRTEVVANSLAQLEEARKLTSEPAIQTRLAQLGMAVYWNYLFCELQREISRNPDAVSTDESGALRALVRWGARIEPTRMIDSYAISRVFTRISAFKKLNSLSEKLGAPLGSFVNGLNGKWWVADRQLGVPSNAEVWERLHEAGRALSASQVSRMIGREELPKRLVPVSRTNIKGADLSTDGASGPVKWLLVPKGMPVVFWAKAGEKVLFPIAANLAELKTPLAVEFHVTSYRPGASSPQASGEMTLSLDRGAWRKAPIESNLPAVEFQAPEEGAYILRLASEAKILGVLLSDDLKVRPLALAPAMGEQGLEYAAKFMPAQEEAAIFYSFWPKSVAEGLVVGNRGKGSMKIEMGSESVLDDQDFGAEEIQEVRPKRQGEGGVAKITTEGVSFVFRGVPLFLSPTAGQVLAPAD